VFDKKLKLVDNFSEYAPKPPDLISIFNNAFELYENFERKKELIKGIEERMVYIEKYYDNCEKQSAEIV